MESFKELSAKTWKDYEALMGENGGCGGCWCMSWRLPRAGQLWKARPTDAEGVRQQLKATGIPVPVQLHWSNPEGLHSEHMLAVTRVTDQHVYLRDPAGEHGLRLPESSQQLLGHGFQRMERAEFEHRLRHALGPL